MRLLLILIAMAILGGCAGPQVRMVEEHEIVTIDDDMRKEMNDKLEQYIEKNRQLVYLPGNWQVMAYCGKVTAEKAHRKTEQVMCKPPTSPDRDAVFDAGVYVLTKKTAAAPGRPWEWVVRYKNEAPYPLCVYASWRLMDIAIDDKGSLWHIVEANSHKDVGKMRQETWRIQGKTILFDFSGHVSGLLVRGVSSDGTCYDTEDEEE